MPRNHMKPRIPAIWNNYTICGRPIDGTRIICFKTPVTCKGLSPEVLLSSLNKGGYKLGLVIDLTDTEKYYDKNNFVALNVVHYKIRCSGMKIPSEEIVEHFQKIVSCFLQEHKHDKKLIGVHCFGGVNRSGYLVCRLLIDVLKWDSVKAIHAFQDARGCNIEQPCFRHDLLTRKPSSDMVVDVKPKCIVM